MSARLRQLRAAGIVTTLVVVVLVVVLLFPLYWMFMTSILPSSVVLSRHPPLLPPLSEISFDAYRTIIDRRPILRWFANSTVITLGSAVMSMIIATLAGYSLSRFRTRGQLAMGYLLLVNRMLPGTLLIIPLYVMFSQAHLINNPRALVLANSTAIVPFSTWMMKGFFDGIPIELEDAAMVDGASQIRAMVDVILPLTTPGLAATAIYSAILAWSDFLFSRTLLLNPDRWTVTVGMASFVGEHMIDWSSLMAAGIISIAPILLLFIFLEPFLVSGMTSGSVKG
jgi:multiple sugar transport system permease protein